MKILGLDPSILVDFYMKEIRVHLELAVPVWHSGLNRKLSNDIERVQKIAIHIIQGKSDNSYEQSCENLGLRPLHLRRQDICERFALKTATKSRHRDLFEIEKYSGHNTRSNKSRYKEHICKKSRFYKSPLPYLTRLLNK